MNILLVDDDYYIVQDIKNEIDWEKLGIREIYVAYSGAQAKEIITKQKIDLLLTDIEMPLMSGLELIRWINEQHYKIVSLILTGHQSFEYAQQAIRMHCFGFILKPFHVSTLEEEIASAAEAVDIDAYDVPKVENDFLSTIKDVVKKNISNPDLGRAMIAEAVHISPDYLSFLFHKKSGQSLVTYILETRMKKACKLLSTTELPLTEISEACGFASNSYFHKQFKKSTGITPQQYRKLHSISQKPADENHT